MRNDVKNITYTMTPYKNEKFQIILSFEYEDGTIEKFTPKIFDSKLDAMIFLESHNQFGFFENI